MLRRSKESDASVERLPIWTINIIEGDDQHNGGDKVKSGKATGGNGNRPHPLNMSAETPTTEVMCWKDPTKVCKCERPQRGVYCGRVPLPTD
jgi:hypothetical protein